MTDTTNFGRCERAEDLISFLYGELDEQEAISFKQHERICAVCKSEVAAFGPVRDSILAWREQALRLASAPFARDASPLRGEQKRSALAAIRSFFELSPLWMKGAAVFAVILFCMLAGVVVFHSFEKPQAPQPQQVTKVAGAPEFAQAVRQRVEAELAALKNNESKGSSTAAVGKPPVVTAQKGSRKEIGKREMRASTQTPRKLRQPLSRAEREQLAADLRLISTQDEDALQLITDRINR